MTDGITEAPLLRFASGIMYYEYYRCFVIYAEIVGRNVISQISIPSATLAMPV